MRADAKAVADSVDLVALATELLGEPKGSGASAKWRSPVPGHAQTGKTPPMSIFVGVDGRQRWKCFSTGEGGDAIDLVRVAEQVDFETAYERLKARSGFRSTSPSPQHSEQASRVTHSQRRDRAQGNRPAVTAAQMEAFVSECANALTRAHPWLDAHGLNLKAARLYGIGRALNVKAPGLKFPIKDGIVLPTTNRSGVLIGADVRTFGQTKYLALGTATNASLNYVRPHRTVRADVLAVTEGSADAYAFAHHTGIPTIGMRSAVYANQATAEEIERAALGRRVILALDDDAAGNTAAAALAEHLPRSVRFDLGGGDVGDLVAKGVRLDRRVWLAVPPRPSEPDAGLGL